jgi:hypothetical protein
MPTIMQMESTGEITTISISRKNHLRLMDIGKKGESFDDIISRVLSQTTPKSEAQPVNAALTTI